MMYVRQEFQDAIRFVQEGKVFLDGFATQHYPLEMAPEAFRFIDEHPQDVLRCMLTL